MKRPAIASRPSDDETLLRETGQSRTEWFNLINKSGASGRAAVGKVLLAQKVNPWWLGTLMVDYEAHVRMVEKDGRPKGYSICSTKSLKAPVARVFKAFTTASDLDKWFGAKTSIGLVEGGAFTNADGNSGTIEKVRPDKALVYTWNTKGFAEGSRVEALFQPKGTGCGVVVNHTRVMTRGEADELRAMWEEALNQLKSHLDG
jgi:uncharacterized protein YndB with AHSA1/START domain